MGIDTGSSANGRTSLGLLQSFLAGYASLHLPQPGVHVLGRLIKRASLGYGDFAPLFREVSFLVDGTNRAIEVKTGNYDAAAVIHPALKEKIDTPRR